MLAAAPSLAQVIPPVSSPPIDPAASQQAQRMAPPEGAWLEGPVDAESYRVGPGDQFTIAVGGNLSHEYRLVVSADGFLLIPEVGRFAVAGLTLAAVDDLVRPALHRLYRNVPAELALTQPRQFYVHVSGAVMKPGRHLVGPVPRAEEAVRAAMEGENPLVVLRRLERYNATSDDRRMLPALRNIRIMHADGGSTPVDLRRYYTTGDRGDNPYLRDGDVVVVPPFEQHQGAVFVEGPVFAPGIYDFRPGDTVASLLEIAAGDDSLPDLGSVRLVRADGSSTSIRLNPDGADVALRAGDRLVVHPVAPTVGTVQVEGRVMYPGAYPVQVGQTTVEQVIEMAGGLRSDALAGAAFLERAGAVRPGAGRTVSFIGDPFAGQERSDSQAEIEQRLQEEAFRSLRLADLDFASRQYLLGELRRTPRVPLDLTGSGASRDGHLTMRDGDRLVIPEDLGGIYVFGQVARSGFVFYREGQAADAYVEQAGGRTSAATTVYVRRAGSEVVLTAAQAGPIQPGDAIFVDRRPTSDTIAEEQIRMQERMLRAQHRQQWIQAGAAILATATALVTAFIFTR